MSSYTVLCMVRNWITYLKRLISPSVAWGGTAVDQLYIKTLKNRRYAARGLAFTYSETDEDFDHMPYVWKVPPDESPVNVQELIDFRKTLKMTPVEIRESVRPLSWKAQMQKVIDAIRPKAR